MKRYKEGSIFRKWDLHIHSPESILANEFETDDNGEKWPLYIDSLRQMKGFSVIGVTDYFSIDGYLKVRDEFDAGNLPNFDEVLPNCELRIIPKTNPGRRINVHFVFNPSIVEKLNDKFFSQLKYRYDSTCEIACTRTGLIDLGKKISNNEGIHENTALKLAAEEIFFELNDLEDLFNKDPELRANTMIIVPNSSNDGASGLFNIDTEGERTNVDTNIRKRIYNFADMIFSGNPSDFTFFSSKDSKEEYGKNMACVHGSDAHIGKKLGKPNMNRFNWIKSDPTFNGLKQLKFEIERSYIGVNPPNFKSSYNIIKRVKFITKDNKLFSNEWIYLNSSLVTIIGGKSSGKSLLLYLIAQTTRYSDESIKWLNEIGVDYRPFIKDMLDKHGFDFIVEWENGKEQKYSERFTKPSINTTYIAQLEINRIAEDLRSEKYNEIVNGAFNAFKKEEFFKYNNSINSLDSSFSRIRNEKITKLLSKTNDLRTLESKQTKIGNETVLKDELKKNQLMLSKLMSESQMTDEEIKKYNDLSSNHSENDKLIIKLETEKKELLRNLQAARDTYDTYGLRVKHINEFIVDAILKEKVIEYLGELKNLKNMDYNEYIINVEYIYSEELSSLLTKKENINRELVPYTGKFKQRDSLNPIRTAIASDEKSLIELNNLKREIKETRDEVRGIFVEIKNELNDIEELFDSIANKHVIIKNEIDYDITNSISFDEFNKYVKSPLRIGYFRKKYETMIDSDDNLTSRTSINEILSTNVEILRELVEDKVEYKSANSKYDIAQNLFRNMYFQRINLLYKQESVSFMSPGKKGMVLLKLIIEMDETKHPILIDQPEDNLDNNTIFNELVNFMRDRKKHRQIIMVSHNANLTVLSDSEQIIVTRQTYNSKKREFQYYTGSIECAFKKKGIHYTKLEKYGIRDHLCDILEGGIDAFKQREVRYDIRNF